MANTAQARKRAKQSETRRQRNSALKSEMRTAMKKVRAAIQAGDKSAAQAQFQESQGVMDAMVGKGVVHANTISRSKSRLSAAVKAMG
ncbi:MAG: 30S ribosomal protein S20 [Betaproteobacteria bacterium]|jgi:small subunit ribosomal protein S20|nr:30S ribosomal protein S20 [Rhodocyclaceae bacterium]MCA3141944.1 30S ribosomal protein S20 [Rhodocyclaceae bacterium]MCE2898746.1 30S ribosomal protein S20 [Betaproteobacteria bacterium]